MKDNLPPLPPLIEGWITNLFNDSNPLHIRENYRDNLDRVARVAAEAVAKFDRKNKR